MFVLQYGALLSVDSTMDQTTLEATSEYVQEMKQGLDSGRLVAEFQSLSRQAPHNAITVAKVRDNEPLNRYWNVLPYDYNRLIIGVVSRKRRRMIEQKF